MVTKAGIDENLQSVARVMVTVRKFKYFCSWKDHQLWVQLKPKFRNC